MGKIDTMRILITGANGMLGRTLQRKLTGFTLIPTDLPKATSPTK